MMKVSTPDRRNFKRVTCPGCGKQVDGADELEAKTRWSKHFRNCPQRARLQAVFIEKAKEQAARQDEKEKSDAA